MIVYTVTVFFRVGGHLPVSIQTIDTYKQVAVVSKAHIGPYHKINSVISEVEEIEDVVEHEEQVIHAIEEYFNSDDSLELKLQKFDQEVIADDTALANRLLRPAMVAALCEFKPISKKLLITMFYYEFKKISELLKDKNYNKNRNSNFPFQSFKGFEKKVLEYLN